MRWPWGAALVVFGCLATFGPIAFGFSISFSTQQIAGSSTSTHPKNAIAVNVNHDASLDVVVAQMGTNSIVWYAGPSFPSSSTIWNSCSSATDVFAADLNSDGWMDVVCACEGAGGKVGWARNNAGSSWTVFPLLENAAGVRSAQRVVAVDLNSDGLLDVVVAAGGDAAVTWFRNTGSSTAPSFASVATLVSVPSVWDMSFADVDGDGDIDFASSSFQPSGAVRIHKNAGMSFSSTVVASGNTASRVALIDLNKDGFVDLVAVWAGDNTVVWYQGSSGGSFSGSAQTIRSSTLSGVGLHVIDMDTDGDLDVITSARNGNAVYYVENLGGATSWTSSNIDTGLTQAQCAVVVDFDGDGDYDVISESWDNGFVRW
jgi:hypothetical protein